MAALGLPMREAMPRVARSHEGGDGLRVWIVPALFAATAALLALRRLDGALRIPLQPATAVLCGLTAIAIVGAWRLTVGKRRERAVAERASLKAHGLLTAALVVTAAALSLPGSKSATLVGLWLPTAAAAVLVWSSRKVDGPAKTKWIAPPASNPARRMSQQISRFTDAAGRDVIEGTTVARFAAGQRTVSVHLAFCPPFAQAPEMACGIASEHAGEIKTAQCLAYAARFDVKLSNVAATSLDVPISFSARS